MELAISHLSETQPVAWAILVFSLIAVAGLSLATIKFRGIGIGIAGVLFAGILVGHWGLRVEPSILEFVREFGLILFVFTIGLQLGPSFFASLRSSGVRLNTLAAGIVLSGALMATVYGWMAGMDPFSTVGLFCGATTNTPSLGAAQQTLGAIANQPDSQITPDRSALPALAYAVGYPVGILGIIGTMLFLRGLFKIDPEKEAGEFQMKLREGIEPLVRRNLAVENPNLDGLKIA
ncbi:MAG: transporter, partial [Verrucomicrobiota bacterium]